MEPEDNNQPNAARRFINRQGYFDTNKQKEFMKVIQRQKEELRKLAGQDSLTGLLLRRAYSPLVDKLVETAKKENLDLSVLAVDLDRFGAFNNAHGHPTGDELLKLAAQALVEAAKRATDIAARVSAAAEASPENSSNVDQPQNSQAYPARKGGEEFELAILGNNSETASIVAGNAQQIYQQLQRKAIESGLLPKLERLQTMCFGIATRRDLDPNATAEDFYQAADKALVGAKNETRTEGYIDPLGKIRIYTPTTNTELVA